MPNYHFSLYVRSLLEKAGWHPGRVAEPPVYFDHTLNYPRAIQAVLREFGGLEVRGHRDITFDPGGADEDDVASYWVPLLGRPLYPIGFTDEYWSISMDGHGAMYLTGGYLSLLGMSFAEAMEEYFNYRLGTGLNQEDMTWGPEHRVINWPELPDNPANQT